MQDSDAKVFFRGDYTKRKLMLLEQVVGMFLPMGLYFAWYIWSTVTQVHYAPSKSLGISALALLICSAISWVACRLLRSAWKDRSWEIVVDSRGVFDGWRFHPWGKIAAFGLVGCDDCYTLSMELKGRFGYGFELEAEPRLTAEQARAVMRVLQDEVVPAFPHLRRIGDRPQP